MTERIDDPELWWKAYSDHYQERTWRDYRHLLAEFVKWAEEGPLLDVGCGYGFLVECARRFGISAVGVEASELALAECRKLHPLAEVRLWHGGEPLNLTADSLGGVMLNEFVDHLTIEQNRQLFQELWLALKPGGILLVKSPSRFNRFDQDKGHLTFFSPSEFRNFVESFSFEVVEQRYEPQPLLGSSRVSNRMMQLITRFYHPEKWAARIDLVARKPFARSQ